MFEYQEMITRNIGFVSEEEQGRILNGSVFVCGVGGMGGAAALGLARAGLGKMHLADIDDFEISNLNRQVFCNLKSVGQHKAAAAMEQIQNINPEVKIDSHGSDWVEHVDELIEDSDVVINGTDDLSASLRLYRAARRLNKPVIDAYASPLPSVYFTRPDAPMPEERLNYPTLNSDPDELSETMRKAAFQREVEYVMINSSSRRYLDLELAGEVASGKRSRMSFAPMVITTGMLMTYEALNWIIKKESMTDCSGWFFNPYRGKIEKPRTKLTQRILRPYVQRELRKLMA